MLEANDITFRVGDKTLIADVSVRFEPGKLHLVIGPNGAGKSTLIKVLARLLRPHEGRVEYDGADVRHGRAVRPSPHLRLKSAGSLYVKAEGSR